jgi:hypothetical protein
LRLEGARGEPDDVGVDRDLDDGVAEAVVWAAGEHAGEGLLPGAGGKLAQPPLLARDPGAGAQNVVDGAGGVADRVAQSPRVVQQGEVAVAALGAKNLGEAADVVHPVTGERLGRAPGGYAKAKDILARLLAGDGAAEVTMTEVYDGEISWGDHPSGW